MATAFRPAGSGDLDQLLESLRAGHAETGGEFFALGTRLWLARILTDPTRLLWVIETNGCFAGYALLHLPEPDGEQRRAYVAGLYVVPALRAATVGETSLTLLRDLARLHNWRLVEHDLAGGSKVPRIPPPVAWRIQGPSVTAGWRVAAAG